MSDDHEWPWRFALFSRLKSQNAQQNSRQKFLNEELGDKQMWKHWMKFHLTTVFKNNWTELFLKAQHKLHIPCHSIWQNASFSATIKQPCLHDLASFPRYFPWQYLPRIGPLSQCEKVVHWKNKEKCKLNCTSHSSLCFSFPRARPLRNQPVVPSALCAKRM